MVRELKIYVYKGHERDTKQHEYVIPLKGAGGPPYRLLLRHYN